MPNNAFRTVATSVLIVAGLGVSYANAADLAWEVVNPFRLYRHDKSFNLHQSAFNAVLGVDRLGRAILFELCQRQIDLLQKVRLILAQSDCD